MTTRGLGLADGPHETNTLFHVSSNNAQCSIIIFNWLTNPPKIQRKFKEH